SAVSSGASAAALPDRFGARQRARGGYGGLAPGTRAAGRGPPGRRAPVSGDPPARAVVFAYHDVGVRCLLTLLAHGVDVPLVVTHADDPGEHHWFASVAETAALNDIAVI